MQLDSVRAALLCTGLTLLLTTPTASQEQCPLPTYQDVKNVADDIFEVIGSDGGGAVVTEVFYVHFTCLATVGLEMYAYATVVANFTHDVNPTFINKEQFQLMCGSDGWVMDGFFEDPGSLPAMPFAIKPQFQCSLCASTGSGTNDYDSDSNCLFCASECLNIGGGFCTGITADNCCPYFNSDTNACVDNCATIGTNFLPDENFTCVCNISCASPGFVANNKDCSCDLTDGCEAAGQPCQNGGNCTSDVTAPSGGPYYTCTCPGSFSGQNCTVCQISCGPGFTVNTSNCSCELTDGCEAAGQPCENGANCTSNATVPPYYSCQCAAGSTGQNCETVTLSSSSVITATSILATTQTTTPTPIITFSPTTTCTDDYATTTSFVIAATPTTPSEEPDILFFILGPVILVVVLAITVPLLVLSIYCCVKRSKGKDKEKKNVDEHQLKEQFSDQMNSAAEKETNEDE